MSNEVGPIYLGIIFDLDGTLIESTIDFKFMRYRVLQYLSEIDGKDILDGSDTIANNMKRMREALERDHGSAYITTMERRVEDICNEVEMMEVHATKEIKGARDVLIYLRKKGHRVGILTRGSRAYAETALQAAGLDHLFDAMVCRDDHDPIEAKPHPEALRRVAMALGVPIERCLLVGDHLMDLECAKSAGSAFLAVLSGHHDREGWEAHGIDNVIPSVAEMPEFIQRIDGPGRNEASYLS
jgi:HAD superfamily hydrolase (TIGR01549 family)